MSRPDKLASLPLKSIKINDHIWNHYIGLVKKEVIPYQWKALNDKLENTEPSHSINNFRIAAGEISGEFEGAVFQDTDVAKWLEAVAYSLETEPDAELEELADETIDLIGRAQQPDGYLDTYFIIKEPELKWTNLKEGHELYTAGHMIEAAVAYHQATGKDHFLHIVCRLADLIADVFGDAYDKCHGYPGHEEIELALIRLYYENGNRKYLNLAKHFIDIRGVGENYFIREERSRLFKPIWAKPGELDPAYFQSHMPVREQKTAEGHAVRATYLYCAMADLAYEFRDKALMDACRTLWDDMTKRRMFITGSIGSSATGERFTTDYDLPNNCNYSESCASIGLAQFGKRMAMITHDASYMDVVERALYNTVLSGIAMDGRSFFYVNPLEVWPANCIPGTSMEHVKPVRQKWFGVACCPPNIARTLASLGQYICFTDNSNSTIYVNMYIGGEIHAELSDCRVDISLNGSFPYDGHFKIIIKKHGEGDADLALRIPDYAENFRIIRGGKKAEGLGVKNGYAIIEKVHESESIRINADIPARFIHANPQVRADEGRTAVVKGPLVYCLEETDNGSNLGALMVSTDQKITEEYDEDLMGGILKLKFMGKRADDTGWTDKGLYGAGKIKFHDTELTAVPYYAWGNRKHGEMTVWIREMFGQLK